VTDRNTALFNRWCTGVSCTALAREQGLTQQRVSQIIHAQLKKLPTGRAEELRARHPHQRYGYRGSRRLIDQNEVIRLWRLGFSAREISEMLGEVKGSKFNPNSICAVVALARNAGEDIPRRNRNGQK
jgi:DNA-binding CsgD family transcriptional regulator